VELADSNSEAHINLGITLEQTGNVDQAAASFKNAIAANASFTQAHYHLAHLRNHPSTTEDIDAMQALFDQPGTSDSEQTLLAYGIGEAHHKLENYDKAFESFAIGHRLKKKTTSFSLADKIRFTDLSIEVFNPDFFDEHRNSGCEDKTPIFILGMPRSGTSLTEQILASQSTVFGAGEQIYLPGLAKESALVAANPYPKSMATLPHEKFRDFGEAYIKKLRSHSGQAARISDTTPMNFLYIGLIAAALPNARIIHCLRDPTDTCLSIFMHPLSTPHSYAHELDDLGAFYKLYQRLMVHWHSVLPGRIHDVTYEKLVTDSEAEIRALLNYCELPFEKACLNFHETERTIRTPSAGQVRQPIHSNSIRRWKHYEKHLDPLITLFESS
jgi:tetratricopeptide (TPR) repeat protein